MNDSKEGKMTTAVEIMTSHPLHEHLHEHPYMSELTQNHYGNVF